VLYTDASADTGPADLVGCPYKKLKVTTCSQTKAYDIYRPRPREGGRGRRRVGWGSGNPGPICYLDSCWTPACRWPHLKILYYLQTGHETRGAAICFCFLKSDVVSGILRTYVRFFVRFVFGLFSAPKKSKSFQKINPKSCFVWGGGGGSGDFVLIAFLGVSR
jgi:hypothetical protein